MEGGGSQETFFPSFEQGLVVIPAVSRGRHVHMCGHSEMEGCYSVFKWSPSINFYHKSKVFLTRCPLVIQCWSLSISLSNFKLPLTAFASGAVKKISWPKSSLVLVQDVIIQNLFYALSCRKDDFKNDIFLSAVSFFIWIILPKSKFNKSWEIRLLQCHLLQSQPLSFCFKPTWGLLLHLAPFLSQ